MTARSWFGRGSACTTSRSIRRWPRTQDLPVEYGALIGTADGSGQAVFPGSPAEAAGLQAGDIIVAIDGEQLAADSDLSTMILPHAVGDTITLRVLRDNSTRDVDVTLGELPAD